MKFSEMPYTRLDVDALKKEMGELVSRLKAAKDYGEARELFLQKEELEKHILTQSTLAQIRHDIDTRDAYYEEESRFWNRVMPELEEYFQSCTLAMLESPFKEDFAREYGKEQEIRKQRLERSL